MEQGPHRPSLRGLFCLYLFVTTIRRKAPPNPADFNLNAVAYLKVLSYPTTSPGNVIDNNSGWVEGYPGVDPRPHQCRGGHRNRGRTKKTTTSRARRGVWNEHEMRVFEGDNPTQVIFDPGHRQVSDTQICKQERIPLIGNGDSKKRVGKP